MEMSTILTNRRVFIPIWHLHLLLGFGHDDLDLFNRTLLPKIRGFPDSLIVLLIED